MIKRCYKEKDTSFKYYGAIGVKVCDEWKNDFVNFMNWALLNGYDENAAFGECTLDRIDVTGDYTPDNCRWVNMKEQNINKRKKCVTVKYNDEEIPLVIFCKEYGLKYSACYSRLKNGWSIDKILETPVKDVSKRNFETIEYDGKSQTITEWSEELGVNRSTIASRLKEGWSVKEALFGKDRNTA